MQFHFEVSKTVLYLLRENEQQRILLLFQLSRDELMCAPS